MLSPGQLGIHGLGLELLLASLSARRGSILTVAAKLQEEPGEGGALLDEAFAALRGAHRLNPSGPRYPFEGARAIDSGECVFNTPSFYLAGAAATRVSAAKAAVTRRRKSSSCQPRATIAALYRTTSEAGSPRSIAIAP